VEKNKIEDRIKINYKYDPETGVVTSLATGESIGSKDAHGYLRVKMRFLGVERQASLHRLAFVLMNGRFPVGMMDHINGDRADNRWVNLREATPSENSQNTQKHRDGHPIGVHVMATLKKYAAVAPKQYLKYKGTSHSLGIFDTAEEAGAAVFSFCSDPKKFREERRVAIEFLKQQNRVEAEGREAREIEARVSLMEAKELKRLLPKAIKPEKAIKPKFVPSGISSSGVYGFTAVVPKSLSGIGKPKYLGLYKTREEAALRIADYLKVDRINS